MTAFTVDKNKLQLLFSLRASLRTPSGRYTGPDENRQNTAIERTPEATG